MTKLMAVSLLLCSVAFSSPHIPDKISGENLVDHQPLNRDFKALQKTTVFVFLSAKCPCSASHENLISQLSKNYPEMEFIGIHANADESPELSRQHFAAAGLSFPVLQDQGGKLADALGAYKTPHAFVFSVAGQLLYSGGVTDSHVGPSAKKQYLQDALAEIRSGKTPSVKEARTLGCVISRDTQEKSDSPWK
jgi:hypothetical protein